MTNEYNPDGKQFLDIVANSFLDYVWLLFTNERFWNISADAKMLYGILLDRMSLSAKYDTDCNTGANQSQTS